MKDTGEVVQRPEEVALEVLGAFNNKMKSIEESLGTLTGNYLRVLRNMTRGRCRTFEFSEVSRETVMHKIRKTPNKSSIGLDQISYEISKKLDNLWHSSLWN